MSTVKKIKRMKKDILTKEDLKDENITERVNMAISHAIVKEYRKRAKGLGIGYQTLMKIKLKEALDAETLESRLENIEAEVFKERA